MSFRSWSASALLFLGTASFLPAADADPSPRVPGFERFYAAAADADDEDAPRLDPITGGRILLGELNCLSCHSISNERQETVSTKQAPVLDEIGSRVRVDWMREFLAKPHATKPGTTMPDVLASVPEVDRAGAVEALVHFLASTGTVTDSHPDRSSAKKGEALFQRIGCVACHASLDGKMAEVRTSVALPDIGKKYSVPSLMAFLKDPVKIRPSGRMPALGLKDEEYRDIAQHFVTGVKLVPNVTYAAYEGSWNDIPDFGTLTPKSTGTCAGFDLTVAGRTNNFGIRFTTYVKITKPGQYQFYLGSDDGSRLTINGDVVVDNGGVHPHQAKSGKKVLDVGFHQVVVDYFQGGGEWTLDLDISGVGIKQQSIASFISLEPKDTEQTSQPRFAIETALVEKGKALFASLGCAACHQMKDDGKAIASTLKARPLAELNPAAGCLAEVVPAQVPRFDLNAVQRTSIAAALKATSQETPAEKVHRTLASLNCYACHKRGQLGGVEEARNAYFDSLQKEMGDEGRLPPQITGVGDKLRPEWLKHVLLNSAEDRKNYMVVKMPKFGQKNIESLVEALVSLDAKPDPLPKVEFAEPEYRVKAAGRHLVGGQALSCIKCHDFGQHPSVGIRALSLTTMHQRLRPEWVDRYLRDPQLYRPGTRMPAPWPFGMATIRDVLNADVNAQIAAVRLYLSDGPKAAVPVGLVREPMELKPDGVPVLYRNFIEGSGSRAIGVGYPERVNLSWDANDMRLALIWHGAFIDASRHWTGRGEGFQPPLGDHLVSLAPTAPFARLASANDSWPTGMARENGYRFLGYKLDEKQRPTFRYAFAGLIIEDQPTPAVKVDNAFAGLERTITLTGGASEPLYYRAAAAGKIEKISDSEYRIDGFWTMSIIGGDTPSLRQSGGHQELIVPVKLIDGKATIKQSYVW